MRWLLPYHLIGSAGFDDIFLKIPDFTDLQVPQKTQED